MPIDIESLFLSGHTEAQIETHREPETMHVRTCGSGEGSYVTCGVEISKCSDMQPSEVEESARRLYHLNQLAPICPTDKMGCGISGAHLNQIAMFVNG